MNFNLAVVAGDGIGPEVMEQNIKCYWRKVWSYI